MARINSRAKGSRGEREVLNLFKNWWGGTFQRRSLGAIGSDIITPDGFHWSLEVKFVKTMKVRHFFHQTTQFIKFWEQAIQQARAEKRKALLVVKAEGVWYVVYQINFNDRVLSLNEDFLRSTINSDGVVIQTVDAFMLDHDFLLNNPAVEEAAA